MFLLWLIEGVISMSSKKLTDIDIIRVLNCCYDKDEIILSLYENNKTKIDLTIQDIIDFINRLCETIEKGDYTSYTAQVAKQSWHTQNSEYIEKLEAENERLTAKLESKSEDCRKCGERTQQVIGILQERLKTAKSEAYKEFVTKAEEKSTNLKDCTGTEVVFTVDDLYDLLKEMVGKSK